MLDRLAPLAHGLRVGIETLLYGFEHVLVLSPRYAASDSKAWQANKCEVA